MNDIKPALKLTLLFIIFTGFVFPGVVYLGAQLFFPFQANGSFVMDSKGTRVGSQLIGQSFSSAKYFHPRPSAAGSGYDGANSGGSNLGPISSKLIQGIKDDTSTTEADETYIGVTDVVSSYRMENNIPLDIKIPVDAVTHSGSGLDPDISPANAYLQVDRIAKSRNISSDRIKDLINQTTKERFLGFWGERRVNVLMLNLKLDETFS